MISPSIGIKDIFKSIGGGKLKSIKVIDCILGGSLAWMVKGKAASESIPRKIERILVIRPGGIGDAIFLLPFLRFIKNENRGITLDILCETRNAQIFKTQTAIVDHIYCYDQPRSFKKLWGCSYDIIVETEQWHYFSALVAYAISSRISIGFATRPWRAKLFTTPVCYDAEAYEIENFKRLFLPVFPKVYQMTDIAHSFIIDDPVLAWAGGQVFGKYLTLFLGASIPLRRLTTTQSVGIITAVLAKNFSIVLLGGQDVAAEGEVIIKEVKDHRVLNFAGKASLVQSAALIKKSSLFIGPDSGIMHLACAVGTPVIAIFGPGNLKKWSPKGSYDQTATLNVVCAPCTRFGYTVPTCRGSYHCMRDIRISGILNDLLNKALSATHP